MNYDYIYDCAEDNLDKATFSQLSAIESDLINVPSDLPCMDRNKELADFVLKEMHVNEENRLVLPALWNSKVEDLLPNNYWLAYNVLSSVLKKYGSDRTKLVQYDEVIQQQIKDGVVKIVPNIEDLRKDRSVSFLAHNAVFRDKVQTTKCRVVLLSNLCERRRGGTLSHNQISLPGPQLNSKILIALTLYRFNKYLLIYDLEKAFLQLCLREKDTDKFHFLWFRDVINNNYEVIALKYLRVPFGMRFSPFLLMISIYYILILDCPDNTDNYECHIRHMLYNLCYMDNLAFSANEQSLLAEAYEKSLSLFGAYSFNLQQYATNNASLANELSTDSEYAKLFGIKWDTMKDTFISNKTYLDPCANTRRKILSTINANYDPIGVTLPLLNRSKLFMHKLNVIRKLPWDEKLSNADQKEWKNITNQINNSKPIELPRYVGDYENYFGIIAYTDASKDYYGVVLYVHNLVTDEKTFLCAKNRLVTKNNQNKTIPVLELLAVGFGVQILQEFRESLTGAFCPISITQMCLYTDSMISLSWLSAKLIKFSKIERKGSIINNTLDSIVKLCDKFPITFKHIKGTTNPADCATRCMSYKLLMKSKFLNGESLNESSEIFALTAPVNAGDVQFRSMTTKFSRDYSSVINFEKYSSLNKLNRILHYVFNFINNLKSRIKQKNPQWFPKHDTKQYTYGYATQTLVKLSQSSDFADVLEYFENPHSKSPELVQQLNLTVDADGIIRVKSKLRKLQGPVSVKYPILLHKKSKLTNLIISDMHVRMKHAGAYRLLAQLNKEFYIPAAFSTVKKTIKNCVVCRKLYGRTVRVNQSDYKSYRINPSQIPFREIAMDHAGPFDVKDERDVRTKVYILIVTCLFTRAVNLIVCHKINSEEFLLALQLHIFDYGIPQRIVSDNGSPIVGGINQVQQYLKDDVKSFLRERNINVLSFEPYPPNASFLGGIVESLVKQVKFMLYSSINKNLLKYKEFCFVVRECNHLVNKRPIACKSLAVDSRSDTSLEVLTPEMLVKGYDVPSIAVVPHLCSEIKDSDPIERGSLSYKNEELFQSYEKMRNVKFELNRLYYDQFLVNLRSDATNRSRRYKAKNHVKLKIGDIVAVRQPNIKPYYSPIGMVLAVEINDLDEVVAASIRKCNGEVIRRHVSDLVLLIESICDEESINLNSREPPKERRSNRKAAARSASKTSALYASCLV